jgi:hypothetical protein
MDVKKITKEQFDKAYGKYPPNWWTRMAFKYFSKSTERKDMKPSITVSVVLGVMFLTGMLGTIMKWPRAVIGTVTWIYVIGLSALVLSLLAAVWMNNARIKKISKDLGISLEDYNNLSDKFYGV